MSCTGWQAGCGVADSRAIDAAYSRAGTRTRNPTVEGLGFAAVGNTLSFDFTQIFNDAIGAGGSSLGIRLQATPPNDLGAWTFDTFRLTSDDPCSPGVNCGGEKVPEPATLGLLALALGGFAAARRR